MPLTPQTPVSHNPSAHILIIEGFSIRGFGEDTGIEFETKTQAEVTVGVDGIAAVEFDASCLHRACTVTVMNGSQGSKDMAAAKEIQRTALAVGARISQNNFSYVDPQKGTTTTSAFAVFKDDPQGGLSTKAGELVYNLFLINVTETQNTLAVP